MRRNVLAFWNVNLNEYKHLYKIGKYHVSLNKIIWAHFALSMFAITTQTETYIATAAAAATSAVTNMCILHV